MRYLILLILLFHSLFSVSQDSHYWNSPYGPGGFFLPGGTIAHNGDSGVYFYNPALLARSAKSGISVNAVLYQLERIRIKNGAGQGLHLKSGGTSSVPAMVAGNIYFDKKKISIAYALIHTPGIHYASSQRKDTKFEVLSDSYSPGTEYFIGQYVMENRVSETRAQIASAIKLNKYISAGLTIEGNMYSQYYSENYIARALVNPGVVDFKLVANDASYLADYKHFGLRFRSGWAFDKNNHHLGLTVNFPMIRIGGTGTIVTDNVLDNIKLTEDTEPLSLLANTRQEKIRTNWKPPLSIAIGYLYELPKTQLYFAAEYFFKVKEYEILRPRNEYFIRSDTGASNLFTADLLRFKDVRKDVANFSFGLSVPIKKNIRGYASVRTDFSYFDKVLYKDEFGVAPYTATWNNYHLQLGANKKATRRNMRAGIILSYGSTNKYMQAINFDDPNEGNLLQGTIRGTRATHLTAGFILSYIQNLD